MPTVSVDKERFYAALGKSYTTEEFDELCFQFGIELDEDTTEEAEKTGERPSLKIDIPANRYDLLCHEGISRALLVFLGKMTQPKLRLSQPAEMVELRISESVNRIRPFASGAVLRGVKFTPENYASFIDLQDKLHQNLGRRRTLVAIGTHDLSTIQSPFTYEALPPKDIVFAPLNRPGQVMDGNRLMEVLAEDRHLNKYLPIIRDSPIYPVILDKNRIVCSLPPVINGEHSKISLATRDIFVDITGTDEARLESALNILVAMFCEYCSEPFTIEPIKVTYADGTSSVQPNLTPRRTTASLSYINSCTGISLDTAQASAYLNRMGHDARPSQSKSEEIIEINVPCTRPDVLHECDIMEDVAVAYGFDNLPRRFPSTNTVAAPLPINKLSDLMRRECAYSGWTEVLPLILCSRDENFSSLRQKDDGSAITLENPKTAEYQVVRTSLLPGLLKTIRENSKHSLPMRTFEVSDVAFKDEITDPQRCARNERHVAAVFTNKSANFEIVHGLLDRLMRSLDVPHLGQKDQSKSKGYYLKASDNPTYFPGRAASIHYRAPPQAPATTDDLSSHGPPSGPILASAVTSKAAIGSTDIEQPTAASDKIPDVLSTAVESLGKALADLLGSNNGQSALARRLQQIGGKGDIEIGHIGVLHPQVLTAFELDLPCSAMEFDLEVFL